MSVKQVDKIEELQDIIASNPKVVVDFGAPSWCVPCRRLAPHYAAAAEKLAGDVLFIEVDIDKAPEIQQHYGIMSVPTVLKFVNGEQAGTVEARTAIKLINELS